jgi:hypothetical protein
MGAGLAVPYPGPETQKGSERVLRPRGLIKPKGARVDFPGERAACRNRSLMGFSRMLEHHKSTPHGWRHGIVAVPL